jgi:hypothetical protein
MKCILAILACLGLLVLHSAIGAILNWKYGGGAIPMLILYVAMGATWYAITRNRDKSRASANRKSVVLWVILALIGVLAAIGMITEMALSNQRSKIESGSGAFQRETITRSFETPNATARSTIVQDEQWETVSVPGICNFQIPPTLEVQAGTYKRLADRFRKGFLEITASPHRVVVQQKRLNDFDPEAFKRYCRVIVETTKGAKGDYQKLDERLVLTPPELKELEKEFKTEFEQMAATMASKGMKMTILSWEPAKVVRVNDTDAILMAYKRSVNDAPPVVVNVYMIFNNDHLHNVAISYRESEKDIWAKDLHKVLGTFKFEKR